MYSYKHSIKEEIIHRKYILTENKAGKYEKWLFELWHN